MGASFEEIQARKKPSSLEVIVPLDEDLADAYIAAKGKLDLLEARLERGLEDPALAAKIDQAEEDLAAAKTALEPACATFVFRALGGDDFDELVEAHPPSKDMRAAWRKKNPQIAALGGELGWNQETFEPALVKACCVDPVLDDADVKAIQHGDNWNKADWQALVNAALTVNQTRRVVGDLGKGSTQTPV